MKTRTATDVRFVKATEFELTLIPPIA